MNVKEIAKRVERGETVEISRKQAAFRRMVDAARKAVIREQ